MNQIPEGYEHVPDDYKGKIGADWMFWYVGEPEHGVLGEWCFTQSAGESHERQLKVNRRDNPNFFYIRPKVAE